jgi:hypothetical protein
MAHKYRLCLITGNDEETPAARLGLLSGGRCANLGELIFSCPTAGRQFNSGFHATPEELKLIPAGKTLRLRCPICRKLYECNFEVVGICKSPNFCRERKDCQNCPFATHCV